MINVKKAEKCGFQTRVLTDVNLPNYLRIEANSLDSVELFMTSETDLLCSNNPIMKWIPVNSFGNIGSTSDKLNLINATGSK